MTPVVPNRIGRGRLPTKEPKRGPCRHPDLEPPRPGSPRHVLEVHEVLCATTGRTFPICVDTVSGVPDDMPVVRVIRPCGWCVIVFTVSEAGAIARLLDAWHGGPLPRLPVAEAPRHRYMDHLERWSRAAWGLSRDAVAAERRKVRAALKGQRHER